MNHEEEIKTAWTLWHLMERLNELIWDQYEEEFIERYLKQEEEKYCQDQSVKDLFWETI
jgi:hypothetical protein